MRAISCDGPMVQMCDLRIECWAVAIDIWRGNYLDFIQIICLFMRVPILFFHSKLNYHDKAGVSFVGSVLVFPLCKLLSLAALVTWESTCMPGVVLESVFPAAQVTGIQIFISQVLHQNWIGGVSCTYSTFISMAGPLAREERRPLSVYFNFLEIFNKMKMIFSS
jgi:hypothetical protein